VTSATTGLAGLAERYAAALFDLAEDGKALDDVGSELQQLQTMIESSGDLQRLVRSPAISSADQHRAMQALLEKTGTSDLVRRFAGVVVRKRRLFSLSDMIRAYLDLMAQRRGETSAEVMSAKALSKTQVTALSAALKQAVGTDVVLSQRVDPEVLGGLVVKIGSRMIDSSLRTKLNRLSLAIKGIG
jgi:F-type H+-transporting ATPase subunit delta